MDNLINQGEFDVLFGYLNGLDRKKLALVKFHLLWIKYRLYISMVVVAFLVIHTKILTCGGLFVSMFTCRSAPLSYLISMNLLGIMFVTSMMYYSNKVGIYRKAGGSKPYILVVILMPFIAQRLQNNWYSFPMFLLPIVFVLCFYGIRQLQKAFRLSSSRHYHPDE
jgi:membrane protein required for beta-lactamase induction